MITAQTAREYKENYEALRVAKQILKEISGQIEERALNGFSELFYRKSIKKNDDRKYGIFLLNRSQEIVLEKYIEDKLIENGFTLGKKGLCKAEKNLHPEIPWGQGIEFCIEVDIHW